MKTKPLFVDVKVGQSVAFDEGRIVVTLEAKSGQLAKLRVHADEDVKIQVPSKPKTGAAQALKGIKMIS